MCHKLAVIHFFPWLVANLATCHRLGKGEGHREILFNGSTKEVKSYTEVPEASDSQAL